MTQKNRPNKNKPPIHSGKFEPLVSNGVEPIPYPIRINRYLALTGVAARRKADELIVKGLVLINGKKASIGDVVKKTDKVTLANALNEKYFYVLYNKPRGFLTHSASPEEREVSITIKGTRLAPVGRLDKDSEGLLLLSNDGRIVEKMLHPKYEHEKEYVVDVDKPLSPNFKEKMEKGVVIEGYRTKKARVRISGETRFTIILTEGKKHQIRRMCAALGYQIRNLRRVRIGNLKIGALRPSMKRELTPTETADLLKGLGL